MLGCAGVRIEGTSNPVSELQLADRRNEFDEFDELDECPLAQVVAACLAAFQECDRSAKRFKLWHGSSPL